MVTVALFLGSIAVPAGEDQRGSQPATVTLIIEGMT